MREKNQTHSSIHSFQSLYIKSLVNIDSIYKMNIFPWMREILWKMLNATYTSTHLFDVLDRNYKKKKIKSNVKNKILDLTSTVL